ncbi:MAG: hypothetical protein FWH03_00870 [Firmicutes bacterium]|nr:hypothetical protein [Bacillota bacterium]
MKKIILIAAAVTLAIILVFGGVMCASDVEKIQSQQSAENHAPLAQEKTSTIPPMVHGTVAPLSLSMVNASAETDELGETQSGKLYADNGQEILYIRETGQLITANGELLHTVSDNAMARYDEVTQELLDSANRSMKIWFDSVSVQHKIQSGSGQTLHHIRASDTLYIATILDRQDGFTKTIYVTRQRYTTNWWDRLLPGKQDGYYYKYYDMNGRHIPDEWFTEHSRAPWWRSALRVAAGLTTPGWLYGVFKGYAPLSSVVVTEAGTFGEIAALLEFATWHPWDKLEGILTANNDGVYNSGVYINPANRQLTDRLGAPIYHIETGLPFVYKDNKILTLPDKKEQVVSAGGILQNGATRQYLRNLGFEEYIHYIDDPEFGIIGVLVLAVKDGDGKLVKWTFPNGEDADGIVRVGVGIDTDGEQLSWKSFWERFGSGCGNILGVLFVIVILIVFLIFWPLIAPVFKAVWKAITAPFRWVKKKVKNLQEKAAQKRADKEAKK